jgi:hypothetical protein
VLFAGTDTASPDRTRNRQTPRNHQEPLPYTHLAIEDKSQAVDRLPVYNKGFGSEAFAKAGTYNDKNDLESEKYAEKYDVQQAKYDVACHFDNKLGKINPNNPSPQKIITNDNVTICHPLPKCPGLESNYPALRLQEPRFHQRVAQNPAQLMAKHSRMTLIWPC